MFQMLDSLCNAARAFGTDGRSACGHFMGVNNAKNPCIIPVQIIARVPHGIWIEHSQTPASIALTPGDESYRLLVSVTHVTLHHCIDYERSHIGNVSF